MYESAHASAYPRTHPDPMHEAWRPSHADRDENEDHGMRGMPIPTAPGGGGGGPPWGPNGPGDGPPRPPCGGNGPGWPPGPPGPSGPGPGGPGDDDPDINTTALIADHYWGDGHSPCDGQHKNLSKASFRLQDDTSESCFVFYQNLRSKFSALGFHEDLLIPIAHMDEATDLTVSPFWICQKVPTN